MIDFTKMPEKELPHFKGGEGALHAAMFTDAHNKILRGRLTPGDSIGYHTHDTSSEIMFFLEGTGRVTLDGVTEPICPGDCHYCPMGHAHGVVNDGDSDLVFLAVVPEHTV